MSADPVETGILLFLLLYYFASPRPGIHLICGVARGLFLGTVPTYYTFAQPDFRPFGQSERNVQEYFASARKSPYFFAFVLKWFGRNFPEDSNK